MYVYVYILQIQIEALSTENKHVLFFHRIDFWNHFKWRFVVARFGFLYSSTSYKLVEWVFGGFVITLWLDATRQIPNTKIVSNVGSVRRRSHSLYVCTLSVCNCFGPSWLLWKWTESKGGGGHNNNNYDSYNSNNSKSGCQLYSLYSISFRKVAHSGANDINTI